MITCGTFRRSFEYDGLNEIKGLRIQLHHETGVARPAFKNLARNHMFERLRAMNQKKVYDKAAQTWQHVQHCDGGVVQSHSDVAISSYSVLATVLA
jgi:hypothetical protein